eukprot:SAG31_NODE_968_length_10678_cov_4.493619_1_plen_282_part_00
MLGNILRAFNHAWSNGADEDDEEPWQTQQNTRGTGDSASRAVSEDTKAAVDRCRDLLTAIGTTDADSLERAAGLDSLAAELEAAEAEYCGEDDQQDPYINARENHKVGSLLHLVFVTSEDTVFALFEHHLLEVEVAIQNRKPVTHSGLAALRLLLSGCPACWCTHTLHPSQRKLLDFLRGQRVVESLVTVVKCEAQNELQALSRLLCTGIMAAAVGDLRALEIINHMQIVPSLLHRLHAIVGGTYADSSFYVESYGLIGLSTPEACVNTELRTILACLPAM